MPKASITATAITFVTDINGNYYFNQTAEAHEAQVDELKANGLFLG